APKGRRLLGPAGHMARVWLGARRSSRKVVFCMANMNQADLAWLRDRLEAGAIRPGADRRSDLSEIADAFRYPVEGHARAKLVVPGCFADGGNAASTRETIGTVGAGLGSVAVIDVGYSDPPDEYGGGFDAVMQALVDAKVERVIWGTLEEREDPWVQNNAVIRAGPKRWPQLVVADWAPVADAHPDWFVDLAHLN